MSMKTKERLAQALHGIGALNLENRARSGEFSDFESEHACPKVVLVGELEKLDSDIAYKMAIQVREGVWDDTKEESEEWFQREGKDLLS